MAEGAQRLASLIVVGGVLKNHRFDLQEVVTEVLIGSDAGCHLKLDLPSVSPIHARIWADLNGATVQNTMAPRGLYVNDDKVEKEAPIKNGDWLWLGAPGDPDSVCVQCHFEEWVEVLPAATAADAPVAPEAGPADSAPIPIVPVAADEPIELMDPAAPPELPGAAPAASSDEGDEAPIPVVAMEEDEATVLMDSGAPPEPPPASPAASASAREPPAAEPTRPPPAEAPSAPVALDGAPTSVEPEQPLVETASPPEAEAPPATPPDAAAGSVSAQPSDEGAFFVDAAPSPPEGRPETPPEAAPAPPPPAAPPPAGPAASDPFFVGEVTAADPEPAPPVAAASDAPAEDHFFISGDAFTDPAPPTPAPEDAFVAADSFEPASENEPVGSRPEAAPEMAAEAVLEAEPVLPADEAPPAAEAPVDGPPSALPEVEEEILAAEVVETAEVVEAPLPPAPESESPPAAPVPEPPAAEPAADEGQIESPPEPASPPASPRAAERPRSAGARRGPAAGRRPPRGRPSGGSAGWLRPIGMGAGGAILLGAVAFGVMSWMGRTVSVEQISPSRVRVGQRATITGSGFSETTSENTVLFGDARAGVLNASPSRLEVAVPEAVTQAGTEKRVTVTVEVGDRSSEPVEVSVFQGPRLHGLSPEVAMPGEEVLLAGAGWGIGATVRFGDTPAEILAIDPTEIRVAVPQIEGRGTAAPVVVSVGGVDSNAAPFFVGRLPLLTGVKPSSSRTGEILTLTGRGLGAEPGLNGVRIAGRPALVVSARSDELQVVVPRLPPGDPVRSIEVFVSGSEEPARGLLEVAADPDPLTLRFVAEPFDEESQRDLAVLATDLGPAFVLAAANGRTAAQRGTEAQGRLNAAVALLAGAPGLVPEARDLTTRPVIGLAGKADTLLQVTAADAAAYNEDWTGLRGRGGPVTPPRLARWWEAVSRDLVLMLVRGERPRFAATLAPEGRVLQQLFDSASAGPGIPRQAVVDAAPPIRSGLRILGLRVPASVTAAVPPAPGEAAAAAPTPTPAPLELEGTWSGSEIESGRRRYLTVTFRRDHGNIAYEGGITLTVPFLSMERPRRDRVRFTVQIRGGIRHYLGQWDGETLSGDIARDEAGNNVVGTFELKRR